MAEYVVQGKAASKKEVIRNLTLSAAVWGGASFFVGTDVAYRGMSIVCRIVPLHLLTTPPERQITHTGARTQAIKVYTPRLFGGLV